MLISHSSKIWIIIFIVMGFYLLGFVKFKNDSKIISFSLPRITLIVATFGFCIYMILGLFGGSLSLLAGIIPPQSAETEALCPDIPVRYLSSELHLPKGFKGYLDYDDARDCAIRQNKPLFIDFTGHACFNCRRMEEYVWSDTLVKRILDEDYVIFCSPIEIFARSK